MINEHLKELILSGKFEIAYEMLEKFSSKEQLDILIGLAYEDTSIAFYTFTISELLIKETTWFYRQAITLFIVPLAFYKGANALGLYHAKRAAKLDPKDLGLKQLILFYYTGVPELFITKDEAIQTINEIFALDPENINACDALAGCNNNKIKNIFIDKSDFSSLLYYGRFQEALELAKDNSTEQIFEALKQINKTEQTITTYGFLINLLLDNEVATVHYLASKLLAETLQSIEGYDIAAYWHAKKACALAPDNKCYELWLQQFKYI